MGRAYSLDLRERVVAAVTEGESCRSVAATFKVSVASVVKWSQRFRATGSAASRRMGGNRPYVLSSERDWLLKRLAEQPDITLRALLAELAERGIKVSYYAVWHFFEHEGVSFKKKPARQRAGASRRGPGTCQMEKVQRAACSSPPGLHRRDLGQNQHDAHPWPRSTWRAAGCQGSTWPLADADLPCCAAPRPYRRSLCDRWADQRRKLPGLCRAGAGARAQARRHRHHRQPRQSQGKNRPARHPGRWRKAVLPAALQPRPQSDRAGFCQAQNPASKGR